MLNVSFSVNLALNVVLTVVHTTAIVLTLLRLYYRTVTRRLWWDDFVAFFAVLLDCAYISALWFAYAGPNSVLLRHESLIVRYWLGVMLFLVVVWMTRISLALAIARIFPPRDSTRRFAIGMAILSTILYLVIVIQTSAICAHQPALNSSPRAACQWSTSLRVLVTVANIFSDALLVATPLYKLWRIRLPRNQRRLILGAFAASAMTTTATIACAVFQFAPEKWEPAKTNLRVKLSYLEAGISLIVCNLLVMVTFVHTMFHRGQDLELSDDTSETPYGWRTESYSHSNIVPSTSTSTPYTSKSLPRVSNRPRMSPLLRTGLQVLIDAHALTLSLSPMSHITSAFLNLFLWSISLYPRVAV
ncbi:hypothetical protein BDZ97DRAFT_1916703 [Flammula alnicola]|nr:hypothetical protein BDZ97DRAFT_1916703 [Flammula alnicola]